MGRRSIEEVINKKGEVEIKKRGELSDDGLNVFSFEEEDYMGLSNTSVARAAIKMGYKPGDDVPYSIIIRRKQQQ